MDNYGNYSQRKQKEHKKTITAPIGPTLGFLPEASKPSLRFIPPLIPANVIHSPQQCHLLIHERNPRSNSGSSLPSQNHTLSHWRQQICSDNKTQNLISNLHVTSYPSSIHTISNRSATPKHVIHHSQGSYTGHDKPITPPQNVCMLKKGEGISYISYFPVTFHFVVLCIEKDWGTNNELP